MPDREAVLDGDRRRRSGHREQGVPAVHDDLQRGARGEAVPRCIAARRRPARTSACPSRLATLRPTQARCRSGAGAGLETQVSVM